MIVTILRKPLEGTVANNVLKHGCGGLNIAKSRIGNEEIKTNGFGENEEVSIHVCKTKDFVGETRKGRWPANVILKHKQGCELKGTKKIKEGKKNNDLGGTERETGLYEDGLKERAKDQHQGEEMVEDWICVKGCPVKSLDDQTGVLHSGKDVNPTTSKVSGFFGKTDKYYSSESNYGDSGGASRFFKQFKKEDDQ